mmetsp:Transcript_2149/g.6527  ORF Transcript_2149/g.6527 Transcript_2149/m.6527 type:complete len:240 (+) Transcript_2149:130-849(+)
MAARSRRALVFCALAVADGFQHLAARPARRVPTDRGSSRRIARAATPGDIAERLADSELVLEFDCFGFYNQDCLLTLGAGGGATFSAGMISDGPGEWRVTSGDPDDDENPADSFLEFSQPMTEVYSELYNVPSGVVFWRGRVDAAAERLLVVDGLAISESKNAGAGKLVNKLTGGGGFAREGRFSARAVLPGDDPSTLPQPVSIELYDDDVEPEQAAAGMGQRKRKRKAGTAPEKGFGS